MSQSTHPPRGRVSFASAIPLVMLLAGASVVAWLGQVSSLLEVDDATRTAVAVARSEIDELRVRVGNLQSEFDPNQPEVDHDSTAYNALHPNSPLQAADVARLSAAAAQRRGLINGPGTPGEAGSEGPPPGASLASALAPLQTKRGRSKTQQQEPPSPPQTLPELPRRSVGQLAQRATVRASTAMATPVAHRKSTSNGVPVSQPERKCAHGDALELLSTRALALGLRDREALPMALLGPKDERVTSLNDFPCPETEMHACACQVKCRDSPCTVAIDLCLGLDGRNGGNKCAAVVIADGTVRVRMPSTMPSRFALWKASRVCASAKCTCCSSVPIEPPFPTRILPAHFMGRSGRP